MYAWAIRLDYSCGEQELLLSEAGVIFIGRRFPLSNPFVPCNTNLVPWLVHPKSVPLQKILTIGKSSP